MIGADASRFWSKVEKTEGCWLWRAGCDQDGYGQFWLVSRKRRIRAHRFAYELSRGVTVPGEMVVMHTCDTPGCVRADHLRLGTTQENTADMVAKGRHAKGERNWFWGKADQRRGVRNGRAKLNDEKVREIRNAIATGGVTLKALALRYGVSTPVIGDIVHGRRWRHVC